MSRRKSGSGPGQPPRQDVNAAFTQINESMGKIGVPEDYQEVVRSLLGPLYNRKPVVAPVDLELFQNPMWSVYERETTLASDRQKKLKDYADMDEDPTIAAALDIYASEACQYSDEHSSTTWVSTQDPRVKEEADRLLDIIGYEDVIEGIARDTAKAGEDFVGPLYNFRDGVVALRYVDPEDVTVRVDRYGRPTGYKYSDSKKELAPYDFIHYKTVGRKQSVKKGGGVYGMSMVEPARRVWRQLKLMEDALSVYRLDLGTRRLVFYVDVGELGQEEAMKVVRQWERAYKKKPYFNPMTQEFISRHSPLALDNHIFWPIRPQSRSRVEYIGGDANITAVADIDYFRRKLAAALKIPMAYLGGDEYSSVRTGLAQMDVYFARIVKKLQRSIIQGTIKLILTHLRLREIPYDPKDVKINMEPVSGIEELQRIEALTAAVQLAGQMIMLGMEVGMPQEFWIPYIMKDILKISESDLQGLQLTPPSPQQVDQVEKQLGTAGKGRLDEWLQSNSASVLRRMDASDSASLDGQIINVSELPDGRQRRNTH